MTRESNNSAHNNAVLRYKGNRPRKEEEKGELNKTQAEKTGMKYMCV